MSLAVPVAASFRFTDGMVRLVLGALDPQQAVARSREGAGPSVSWLVGHMLHYRCLALKTLGKEKVSPYGDLFGEAGATDGAGYPSPADLIEQWNAWAEELESVVAFASDEQLEAQGPAFGHGEQKVLDTMTFFTWHEAYHMGALSTVLKDLGLPGIADRVMAARRA